MRPQAKQGSLFDPEPDQELPAPLLRRREADELPSERLRLKWKATLDSRWKRLRRVGLAGGLLFLTAGIGLVTAPLLAQDKQCQYTIAAVGRRCQFTPRPTVGQTVCSGCRAPCPTLPKANCTISRTVLRRKLVCDVTLQQAPLASTCQPCPVGGVFAQISCE